MKRDKGLDLVRCLACIFIVIYHFMVGQDGPTIDSASFNNSLGGLAVSLFFIISGAALYLSMTKKDGKFNIGSYIFKRFKAIYPAFWVAFLIAFIFNFFITRHIDQSIPVYRIWLSIAGMDGTFLYAAPNYYLVGDWFVGAIIITYMYYPLLKYLIDKFPKITWIVVIIIYIIYVQTYNYQMEFRHNPFSFVIEVMFGIYYAKYIINGERYNRLSSIIAFCVSVLVLALLLIFYIENDYIRTYATKIMGIALFLLIYQLSFITNNAAVDKVVNTISINSYYIFLVHHFIEGQLELRFADVDMSGMDYVALFLLYIALIIPFMLVVKVLSKKLIELINMIPQKSKT